MRDSPTPTPDAAASRAAVGTGIFGGARALPVSTRTEGSGVEQADAGPR